MSAHCSTTDDVARLEAAIAGVHDTVFKILVEQAAIMAAILLLSLMVLSKYRELERRMYAE